MCLSAKPCKIWRSEATIRIIVVHPKMVLKGAAVTAFIFHFRSPSVMGILVAERKFLGEIGLLDEGMKVYGGENVELGIRVSKVYLPNIKYHTQ